MFKTSSYTMNVQNTKQFGLLLGISLLLIIGSSSCSDSKTKTSDVAKEITTTTTTAQSAQKNVGLDIGMIAPDFTMGSSNGNPLTLSSLKGNVIMIDFWATWCPPCVRSIPEVKKLWATYKDKQFKILGVSLDRDLEDWKTYIQENDMTWLHVADGQFWDNAAAKSYAIGSVPSVWLLDKEGTIVLKDINPLADADLIQSTIKDLLKK